MLGITKVLCFKETTLCTVSIRLQEEQGFPVKGSTSLIKRNIVACRTWPNLVPDTTEFMFLKTR